MRTIIIFALLLILIAGFSGFIKIKDGRPGVGDFSVENISNNYRMVAGDLSKIFDMMMGKISKPPPDYELHVTEARYLKECIEITIDKKEPCLFVNLEIFNNHSERVDFEMAGKTIVTGDGKQIERYGGLFNTKQLNGECDSSVYFKLFPNARTNTGLCFPIVDKSDDPVMYIKMIANGNQKEHNFDLKPLIP